MTKNEELRKEWMARFQARIKLITMKQAADLIDVHPAYISRIFHGKQYVSLDRLMAMVCLIEAGVDDGK
jgi:hypothetical protein